FKDVDDSMLVELRGTGSQTVYPPSLHEESGERITWHCFTEPASVQLADLCRAVGEVAACALLARHWPNKGSRHEAAMALAGGLLRAGWEEQRADRFLAALTAVARDEEPQDRAAAVRTTAEKLAEGEKIKGWPTLAKALGLKGDEIVSLV